ncbi:unnamed protein product [Sphacelaria rigidula]
MSMLGCAWALRSRSRPASKDIFDLAEVIKLVVANVSGGDIDPDDDSAVRVFVHKEGDQFVVTLEGAKDIFSPRALCRSGMVLLRRLGTRLGLSAHPHPLEAVDNYDHGTGVDDLCTTPPPTAAAAAVAGVAATTTTNGPTDPSSRHVGSPARDIENNQDPSSATVYACRGSEKDAASPMRRGAMGPRGL